MTTERAHKADCRYVFGEGCTCSSGKGSDVRSWPEQSADNAFMASISGKPEMQPLISEDGRRAVFQEQLVVTNQIATNKRQIEVACEMITNATAENKKLYEKQARLDRDMERSGKLV